MGASGRNKFGCWDCLCAQAIGKLSPKRHSGNHVYPLVRTPIYPQIDFTPYLYYSLVCPPATPGRRPLCARARTPRATQAARVLCFRDWRKHPRARILFRHFPPSPRRAVRRSRRRSGKAISWHTRNARHELATRVPSGGGGRPACGERAGGSTDCKSKGVVQLW